MLAKTANLVIHRSSWTWFHLDVWFGSAKMSTNVFSSPYSFVFHLMWISAFMYNVFGDVEKVETFYWRCRWWQQWQRPEKRRQVPTFRRDASPSCPGRPCRALLAHLRKKMNIFVCEEFFWNCHKMVWASTLLGQKKKLNWSQDLFFYLSCNHLWSSWSCQASWPQTLLSLICCGEDNGTRRKRISRNRRSILQTSSPSRSLSITGPNATGVTDTDGEATKHRQVNHSDRGHDVEVQPGQRLSLSHRLTIDQSHTDTKKQVSSYPTFVLSGSHFPATTKTCDVTGDSPQMSSLNN